MVFCRRVGMFEVFPKGYRPAWWDVYCHVAACYPIGLHLVAMLAHWLWGLTFWYRPSRLEREFCGHYKAGFDAGVEYAERKT